MKSAPLAACIIAASACSPHALPAPDGASRPEPATWHSLFDGSSLAEWRGYCRSSAPESWVAEDGALHLKPPSADPASAKARADLITRSEYENFTLALEWKIAQGGNSGIFYRAPENCSTAERAEAPIYESAPEMQVLDNERHPDAKLGVDGNRQAGSLYDLIPANPQNARPAGEWNQVEIQVDHDRVSLQQNGQTVVEYELGTPGFQQRVAESKFKGAPGFIEPARRGHIGLQDHGNEVWFRNIRIREQ